MSPRPPASRPAAPAAPAAHDRPALPRVALRLAFVLPVVASLLAGLAGGLVRAGVALPAGAGGWLGPAAAGHAFLMICTFMGTVIGIERAVAVKHPLAFAGPAASVLGGLALLAGAPAAAHALVALAALAFVGVNGVVVRRQRAPHTVLLLVGALAWCLGAWAHALGAAAAAVVPWWFAFLVLTIAAERLEMTRLMRRRAGAAEGLAAVVAALLAGAALCAVAPPWGGAVFGLALAALALWLLAFDIARRTVRAPGLSRYMAVCLLLGYGWLLVAGAAWVAVALGHGQFQDAALHALAIGFVFSMVLGHAPVILPAVARVKLLFGPAFYLPLALLHGSLLWRLGAVAWGPPALASGAAANVAAIVAFALTLAGAALAWRLKHPALTTPRPTHAPDLH